MTTADPIARSMMSVREQAAFKAGIEVARQMAMTAAITIEVRNDAGELRQQAAVAALQGLAAGLADAFLTAPASDQTSGSTVLNG